MAESNSVISNTEQASSVLCPICMGVIQDPRALPCGHSYCGPPEKCLTALQKPESSDLLICALCNETHRLKIEDLKPLYGFRELLENHSSEVSGYQKEIEELKNKVAGFQKKQTFEPPMCRAYAHLNRDAHKVQFWCVDCKLAICEDCQEDRHHRHLLKSFKRYLQREIQLKLTIIEQELTSSSTGTDIFTEIEHKTDELYQKLVSWKNFQTQIKITQKARSVFEQNKQKLYSFVESQDGCSYEVAQKFLGTNYSFPDPICSNISTQTSLPRNDMGLLKFNFGNPRFITELDRIKWSSDMMFGDGSAGLALGIRKVESPQHNKALLLEVVCGRAGVVITMFQPIKVGIYNYGDPSKSIIRNVEETISRAIIVAVSIFWGRLLDKGQQFLDPNGELWLVLQPQECFNDT